MELFIFIELVYIIKILYIFLFLKVCIIGVVIFVLVYGNLEYLFNIVLRLFLYVLGEIEKLVMLGCFVDCILENVMIL